jgi:hypothetical protein
MHRHTTFNISEKQLSVVDNLNNKHTIISFVNACNNMHKELDIKGLDNHQEIISFLNKAQHLKNLLLSEKKFNNRKVICINNGSLNTDDIQLYLEYKLENDKCTIYNISSVTSMPYILLYRLLANLENKLLNLNINKIYIIEPDNPQISSILINSDYNKSGENYIKILNTNC